MRRIIERSNKAGGRHPLAFFFVISGRASLVFPCAAAAAAAAAAAVVVVVGPEHFRFSCAPVRVQQQQQQQHGQQQRSSSSSNNGSISSSSTGGPMVVGVGRWAGRRRVGQGGERGWKNLQGPSRSRCGQGVASPFFPDRGSRTATVRPAVRDPPAGQRPSCFFLPPPLCV